MIEAKFFTVGTYLYKYNLTVLFVSPSKIAHDKFYIYCPPLLLNEIYAHENSIFPRNPVKKSLYYLVILPVISICVKKNKSLCVFLLPLVFTSAGNCWLSKI